ncbi:MAG: hypothetical protein ABIN67_07235 [Ferruginibacter sp.]
MMRFNNKHYIYFLAIVLIFTWGCSSSGSEQYGKLVKKELARGKRVDSLFLGMRFGMTSKEFYGHCWELNKKGLLTDGNNNTAVLYKIDKELKYPASMTFYPDFYENKIAVMRVSFQYNAWAPWNKGQFSDSLLPDVVKMYEKWYHAGNNFIKITDKTKGTIYVKVDGNRRITIGIFNDMVVKVDYTDLLVEQKVKKEI